MYDVYRIKALKTLTWWILASLFTIPLAAMALVIIGVSTVFVGSILFEPLMDNAIFVGIAAIIAVPIAGAIIGAVVAFLQRIILRKQLYWAADKWLRWTMFGGAVGASLVIVCMMFFGNSFYEDIQILFMMPIFLACVSSFQFIALRHVVKQAWLWIIANIVGGVVFAAVPLNNQVSSFDPNSELNGFGIGLLAVLSLGFITGLILIFLFDKKLLPMRPGLDEDLPDESEPKSVWDRAI